MQVIGQGALHKLTIPILFIKVRIGGSQVLLDGKCCFSSHVSSLALLPLEPLDHIQDHGADDLQALRAQLVHGVGVGVPRIVVEID